MYLLCFQILKELDVIWGDMQFNYELHNRTGKSLLKSDEELIETLEENQVRYHHYAIINYLI